MQKVALLILAHRSYAQLTGLVSLLAGDFDLYVHIDKRSDIPRKSDLYRNAKVYKRYKVYWGHLSIVKAELFLLKKIAGSGVAYSHVVFLSADSLPLFPPASIRRFLSDNPVSCVYAWPSPEAMLERIKFFWGKENIPGGRGESAFFHLIRRIQAKYGLYRKIRGRDQFGSQWIALTLDHVKVLLKNGNLRHYRYVHIADESYFQNEMRRLGLPFVNTSLVYSDFWEDDPCKDMDEKMLEEAKREHFLFCRKVPGNNAAISASIHRLIAERQLTDPCPSWAVNASR
jgi:hypothetical protein